nr:glycerol-3-phosphate acyltransferase [Negativicutes bacterium]
ALTRYVSLGSVLGAGIAPIFAWYLGYPSSYQVVVLLASLFVIIRHRENIIRLFQGTESKVGRIAADKEEPK